jgi:hypothetical protein
MGWSRCGRYYYLSVRRGRSVERQYVGRGTPARAAAQMEQDSRRERAARALALQEERDRLEALEGSVADLCGLADALARAALLAAGFHQHRRQWRRRRMGTTATKAKGKAAGPPAGPQTPEEVRQAVERVRQEGAAGLPALEALLARAHAGDEAAVPLVRVLFAEAPGRLEALGDLARHAEMALIVAAAGKDLAFKEGLLAKLVQLRADLAGPSPSPLERLLVGRVAACWLQVQDADIRYAQNQRDCTFAQGDYYQRRQDRAHRRFLSAIKALALVRRLALPVLVAQVHAAPRVCVNNPGRTG